MEIGIGRAAGVAGVDWAAVRIGICYRWRLGRAPDLTTPRRFTELVQLRKLHDRDARMVVRHDKVAAKQIVGDALGREWVIPIAASWDRLPSRPCLTGPSMIKARHGCNQNAAVATPPGEMAWQRLRARAAMWTRKPYGFWLDEWAYRDVPRGVIAEPLMGDGATLPIDYKVYVFAGQATHVQVHTGRGINHKWSLFDRTGTKLATPTVNDPPLPDSLAEMLSAAETLARNFHFARVDFYEIAGKPMFGEFCFYPGSGLDRFEEDWIDEELGRLWLAAL